jgi:hypothetical protein
VEGNYCGFWNVKIQAQNLTRDYSITLLKLSLKPDQKFQILKMT